jgi:ParB family chromosome partitioning protein
VARRKGFFDQQIRPQDELARQQDVEALLSPRQVVAQNLPVERIRPNPFQARQNFDGLEELVEVIHTLGFTTRLRVRPDPAQEGFFQMVFGERRLRAAKKAGLITVPCDIAEHSDEDLIEIGLAENIQRRDLDPLVEARAFRTFIDQRGYTIRRLAERIGKDKSYIEGRLALLRAPEDVQQMVVQRSDTIRAAWEIAKLPTAAERQPLIEGLVSGTLNKEDVRTIIRTATTTQDGQATTWKAASTPAAQHPGAKQRTGIDDLSAYQVQRTLERDIYTLRAMFARWEEMLERGTVDQIVVLEAIGKLIGEVERLTEVVKHETNPRRR